MNSAVLTGLAFMALGLAFVGAALFAGDTRTGLRAFSREACLPFFGLGLALTLLATGAFQ